ncbi:nucleotide pyrophosphatase [Polaribacter sp. ALD11]|uniref:alkaline phosphatase family protein n=1 Tax=Polaribacter sp. ALD11 TaxID=2058137 RepID=UPI000C30C3F2|nr:alkaline phosphatase family protein [Polaribacter sp. ALD11]AUC83959.1 nucleotide pyrophosphatase [Polaribacter sp. ALD11]
MKLLKLLLIFLFLGIGCKAKEEVPVKKKKVVFIIVDGVSNDQLKKANTPILDAIAEKGSYSDAFVGGIKETIAETPTISAVGYNSLLTGTWANKHNVYGNSIHKPNYNYPTIFRFLKDSIPDLKTAIFSTWLDNRTKLVGENLPATRKMKLDYHYDGFELDTVGFPHDRKRKYIRNIDSIVSNEANRYIKKEAPDVSWVYLQFSDDMGHGYGDSKEFDEAVYFEDTNVGKIYEAVNYREKNFNEDWLFIVTTDHGRSVEDGRGHGGQSDRERSTWMITNKNDFNKYFKTSTVGIVDVFPTITDFFNVDIPAELQQELDGISFYNSKSVKNFRGEYENDSLHFSWDGIEQLEENATISFSTTNNFKKGSKDNFIELATVKLSDTKFTKAFPTEKTDTIKCILTTKNQILNTTIILKN